MSPRIGLVHATLAAIDPMVVAFREQAAHAKLLHFLDEGLLEAANAHGLTDTVVAHFERLVDRAVDSGVDGILLTCSAFSPLAPGLRQRLAIPLVSADEAMLERAVQLGERVGVIATVEAAGPTTVKLLQRTAEAAGRTVAVKLAFAAGAFAALRSGDTSRHDQLIHEQIATLGHDCDVVMLAQISMARAAATFAGASRPILTSPTASIEALLARLTPAAAGARP